MLRINKFPIGVFKRNLGLLEFCVISKYPRGGVLDRRRAVHYTSSWKVVRCHKVCVRLSAPKELTGRGGVWKVVTGSCLTEGVTCI